MHALKPYQKHFQSVLDSVDETLGEKFCSHLLEPGPSGSPDKWSLSTRNAQPAIVTSTYVLYTLLRQLNGIDLASNPKVSYLLGHSLGEYTALLLGGALTLPQTIDVVRRRGVLMEEVVGLKKYAMMVLMFRPADYDTIVSIATEENVLACANSSTQILISGEPATLKQAIERMNEARKRVLKLVELPVSIPFHNEVLRPIEQELANVQALQPNKPIISNLTGRVCEENAYDNTVRCNSRPVQWKKSMELLTGAKVINLGPGTAVDAINSRFKVTNFAMKGVEDFDGVVRALKE